MDKKVVEEMAQDLYACQHKDRDENINWVEFAKNMQYKGYRKVIPNVDFVVRASDLINIREKAIKEIAEKFHEKCKTELKVLAWEYGEGASDVINIFNEIIKEVCGE